MPIAPLRLVWVRISIHNMRPVSSWRIHTPLRPSIVNALAVHTHALDPSQSSGKSTRSTHVHFKKTVLLHLDHHFILGHDGPTAANPALFSPLASTCLGSGLPAARLESIGLHAFPHSHTLMSIACPPRALPCSVAHRRKPFQSCCAPTVACSNARAHAWPRRCLTVLRANGAQKLLMKFYMVHTLHRSCVHEVRTKV